MPVNAKIPEPRPPGPWVTKDSCECGAVYDWDADKVRWADGVERMRLANGEDEHGNGGGFRSRSAILWAMHVVKVEAWYLAHSACDQRPMIPMPQPPRHNQLEIQ